MRELFNHAGFLDFTHIIRSNGSSPDQISTSTILQTLVFQSKLTEKTFCIAMHMQELSEGTLVKRPVVLEDAPESCGQLQVLLSLLAKEEIQRQKETVASITVLQQN